MKALKYFAGKLPKVIQQEMKRIYFLFMIKMNKRMTSEPEYDMLSTWLNEGDWAIDIGANIGVYTMKISDIIGKTGRVFSVEPVPNTFAILSSNIAITNRTNVTLLNLAASNSRDVVGMNIPIFSSGLENFYEAHVTDVNPSCNVYCMPIDDLHISKRVKLIKIDAEGHDFQVLKGLEKLIIRDSPILIVESNSDDIVNHLNGFGYSFTKNQNSPNSIFQKILK